MIPLKEALLKIRVINKSNNELPAYAKPGDAGLDIRANEMIVLKEGETLAVSTGLYVEIPIGFELQVRPRSGLAVNYSVGVLNSPGTIDSGFRGEIKVILHNYADATEFSHKWFVIRPGDRIAQLVLAPVYKVEWDLVEELNETERGAGGLGHSGV